jgi:hypothetical protein
MQAGGFLPWSPPACPGFGAHPPPFGSWPGGHWIGLAGAAAAGFGLQAPVEKSGLSAGQVHAPVPPGRT